MLTINTTKFKRIAYSFVIAFVFWFFIESEESYSVNLDIPLVARNLQEQKTYKEEVPESIFVTLKGSGRSFIWLRIFSNFYKDDFKAVIDLSSISDTYITEIGIYDNTNNLLAVAKPDRPIKKPKDEPVTLTLKLKF